jgi:bifunctional N-acetylglucosamine-1-phosphate-uridyltransferase/glucosamine-1-phosphate-acetyltransferase GlmU-like protein
VNILILAAGEKEATLNDSGYPFYLTELEGIPLIERLITQCQSIKNAKYHFALPENEIKQWRLDSVIKQLAPNGQLIQVKINTKGAACTALLAIEHIDSAEPLLILNMNDMLKINFADVIHDFESRQLDAGTIVFHSVHPRYSYVSLDADNLVIEAAEKNPISQHATTGFYWFARGEDFIAATRSMIAKDGHVDGLYYICPVMNELILGHAKIGVCFVDNERYHPLKTMRQIQHYESVLEAGRYA